MCNCNKNNENKCNKCSDNINKIDNYNNNEVNLFICYSKKLAKFLMRHEMKYYVVGLNPNNYKKFYVFIKNEKLCALLRIWSVIKRESKKH